MSRKLTLWVISLHLIAMVALIFSPMKKGIKPRPSLLIRTVQLQPPSSIRSSASTKKPLTKIAQKKKAPSLETVKTPPKELLPPKNLLKEFDEALAKIEKRVYAEPEEEGSFEKDEACLVDFLRTSLSLPEIGEVKLKLTIDIDGGVKEVTVLQAESQKNRAYLEKHLLPLVFPLKLDKKTAFTLTFCNEI